MTDYYNKYIKYKTKYLELKSNDMIGGGNLLSTNEKKLLRKLSKKIIRIKDKSQLIFFINHITNKKYTIDNFVTINNIRDILKTLTIPDLVYINNGENFNLYKMKKPNVQKIDLEAYIYEKKLKLSYSINNNGQIINNTKDKIYPMHSIGKVFTGFLIMLLLNENIITENDINSPLQLDDEIKDKLPKIILDRLTETTMLNIMTHMSGLTDYLGNYFEALKINNNENPIEAEDFIKYIDSDVKEKNKFNYSNTGLLLCGLSIKHLYNKKTKENMAYNQILEKYIIKPSNLKTFSITKPDNAIFNKNGFDKFINGSPAGGYWISPDDLAKFGVFILTKVKENPQLKKYLESYGREFYYKNIISHDGMSYDYGSSCWLSVYLNYNISIAIMDNNGKDSGLLKMAIDYFS